MLQFISFINLFCPFQLKNRFYEANSTFQVVKIFVSPGNWKNFGYSYKSIIFVPLNWL